MGSISSGVGLISGINTAQLIDQLMAVEARPRTIVQQRVALLQSQKTAFLDINARLLALQTAGGNLGKVDLFATKKVTSSNTSVLTATASKTAAAGNYTFTVDRLVSTHQLLSTGFPDADSTAVGATTLRFESAAARLDSDNRLALLNGETGVQRGKIRITDRSGAGAEIDLTKAVTLDDVVTAINNAAAINVKATLGADGLVLTDQTGLSASSLVVQDLGGTTTAANLGLAGNSAGTNVITGSKINKISTTSALANLNDGVGVRIIGGALDDFSIADSIAGVSNINLDGARTVGDVITKINAQATGVTASLGADGVSLTLTSTGGGDIDVAAVNSSKAAADLGLVGSSTGGTHSGTRVIAALGSKLLKGLGGGTGATGGVIDISGTSIDLSAARSVSDIISAINTQSGVTNVTAALNSAGNGLTLKHANGAAFTVSDTSGTLAASLNIAGTSTNGKIESGDRDLQWVSENTRLDSLNGGKGITAGKFKITNSAGASAVVDLTQGDETTIYHVIKEINSRGIDVTATINATGDGILLTDTAGGGLKLKVEESGSTTAKDLGILGADDDLDGKIDGSFEKTVSILATDKLNDVVNKINSAGVFVTASIINDGSGATPYRLNIVSKNSGVKGQILMDDGGVGLSPSTLVKGQDAVVLFGSADPAQALLVTSSTNSLNNTINGVTISLAGASSSPVTLAITRDDSAVVSAVKTFVTAFNGAVDTLNKYDKYNAETKEKGLLLGDGTVSQVRSRLYNLINTKFNVAGSYQFLSQAGLTVGQDAKIILDEAKLTAALSTSIDSVASLFTATTTSTASTADLPAGVTIPNPTTKQPVGFGPQLESVMKALTDSVSGTLTLRSKSIDNQVDLNNKRITQLTDLLSIKRSRLEAQYSAMETALAQLQGQQNALASLASVASLSGGG